MQRQIFSFRKAFLEKAFTFTPSIKKTWKPWPDLSSAHANLCKSDLKNHFRTERYFYSFNFPGGVQMSSHYFQWNFWSYYEKELGVKSWLVIKNWHICRCFAKKVLWRVHGELNMRMLYITYCQREMSAAISLSTIKIVICFWEKYGGRCWTNWLTGRKGNDGRDKGDVRPMSLFGVNLRSLSSELT